MRISVDCKASTSMDYWHFIKQNQVKLLATFGICLLEISVGMAFTLIGPTLLDLQVISKSTLPELTIGIVGRSLGLPCGSLLSMLILRYFRSSTAILCMGSLLAICVASTPWCSTTAGICTILCLTGLTIGSLEVLCSPCAHRIWTTNIGRLVQITEVAFKCGIPLAAFVSSVFTVDIKTSESFDFDNSNATMENPAYFNLTTANSSIVPKITDMSYSVAFHQALYPYSIVCLMTVIAVAIVVMSDRKSADGYQEIQESDDKIDPTDKKENSMAVAWIAFLSFLYITTYVGVLAAQTSFLTIYTATGLNMSQATGQYATGILGATSVTFQVVSIFLSTVVNPLHLLFSQLGILILGNILLLTVATKYQLFCAAFFTGIGISSFSGLLVSYLEQSIRLTTVFVLIDISAMCFGEALFPGIIGTYFERYPNIVPHISTMCSGLALLWLLAIIFSVRKFLN